MFFKCSLCILICESICLSVRYVSLSASAFVCFCLDWLYVHFVILVVIVSCNHIILFGRLQCFHVNVIFSYILVRNLIDSWLK